MSDLTIPELNKRLKKLGRIGVNKDDEYIAELEARVEALEAELAKLKRLREIDRQVNEATIW